MSERPCRHLLLLLFGALLLLLPLSLSAQDGGKTYVKFRTNKGSFTIELYDDTPLHKAAVLEHVRRGDYDGLLFHRVIKNFMVQMGGAVEGDSKGREMKLEELSEKRIPKEIVYPKHFHKRGAVAAARLGDDENPSQESDGIQFYVCVGQFFLQKELEPYRSDSIAPMTDEVMHAYMTEGGVPHLDGRYTVFGEVVRGMNTILKIQDTPTGGEDRPLKPVYVKSVKVVRRP